MITTCPKCTNRYHLDLESKTVEVILVCPSCNHRWISKRTIHNTASLDLNNKVTEEQSFKIMMFEKFKKNKNLFILFFVLCAFASYILQPLIKSGIYSLSSLLKTQKVEEISLKVENIDYFLDEKEQTLSISWELKNETNVSKGLKSFRIQLFSKCIKTPGDCLVKEVKFNPSKDIILPKEILRFEHSLKCSIPVTKIQIFP